MEALSSLSTSTNPQFPFTAKDAKRVYYLNREIKGADRDSFTVCTPLDAPPLADHLARDKEHFYQNDEMIEEPLWRERLHELKPEQ